MASAGYRAIRAFGRHREQVMEHSPDDRHLRIAQPDTTQGRDVGLSSRGLEPGVYQTEGTIGHFTAVVLKFVVWEFAI